MILNAAHLKKSFVGETVIDDASFFLNEHDKAAIVGPNGAGKSTLLNLLTGELPRDEGEVTLKKDCSLGYLHQDNTLDSELTIEEELTKVIQPILDLEAELSLMQREMKHAEGAALEKLLAAYTAAEHRYELMDGYAARSRVTGIIRGLGFSEADATRPLSSLSGGQKTRVFLGKLLLEQPDLILLDEPTNHLDLESIEWLETYLMNYAGAVLIVSHDRFFLDRIVNKIFDLNHGKVTSYDGNYTQFTEKKEALAEAAARAYENQQAEIKHQEAVIQKLRAFNREKSIKRAESREKLLDKVERLDNPYEAKKDMALYFTPDEVSGNDVLSVEHLSKAFGDNVLFSDLNFSLKRGEHVAIMGGNGTGKTTLSTDPKRLLIGDDEHGWDDNGVFNFEGGCYAKVINLDMHAEPDIYGAIKRNALLENVTLNDGGAIDFADKSVTENTRVSYPLSHIKGTVLDIVSDHSAGPAAKSVIFLSADAFGVLPPVSILTPEQMEYYFLSGFTSKLAGTERGITKPTPTFSACFGQAFLELHPTKYAEELVKRMKANGTKAYLVNTGWNGSGKRISIRDTRGIIDDIHSGAINKAPTKKIQYFDLEIPTELPGVDSKILDPKDTYMNPLDWENEAKMLAKMFIDNFKKYETNDIGKALVAAGPKL